MKALGTHTWLMATLVCGMAVSTAGADLSRQWFYDGNEAYRSGNYEAAAKAFRQAVALKPASGSLQNLGNAEWQRRRVGEAILAWEQALWVNPFNSSVRNNLRFARKIEQLPNPELTWYEVVSTWLPVNSWAWITGLSLWSAVSLVVLPGILRWRKLAWHQALAACGFAVFLLSVPAHFGINTRSRVGFVLGNDVSLRLTPTREAQTITRIEPGEPVRWLRHRGRFVLVRTNHATGWLDRDDFRLISDRASAQTASKQHAS
ncbi:MAG TPA: tetratricopeptide repeat protein [Clostridia bacterium]|nr:tetratricopeptide repeat protein [Clostridia bacterium]